MDMYRTSNFVIYREVVLSSEVKMYLYDRKGTSKCVHISTFILSVYYWRYITHS